jgi:mannosidase alpha-like ER degradation enhancer 2
LPRSCPFDKDLEVKHFEVVIRLLGGLLSAYQLTGDERLLKQAEDLGKRLLPAFDTPTGLPYVNVNLRTGKGQGTDSNPAEAGTLLLEYGTLSRLTGNPVYYEKAKRALVETYKRRSKARPGRRTLRRRHRQMDAHQQPTSAHASTRTTSTCGSAGSCSTTRIAWRCGRRASPPPTNGSPRTSTAALWSAGGHAHRQAHGPRIRRARCVLSRPARVFGRHRSRGSPLQASSFAMWNLHGIEPEAYDYRKRRSPRRLSLAPGDRRIDLVLYRLTGDPQYRVMGRKLFEDFVRHCRTEAGYAAIDDVTTMEQADEMESFVLAETFKYFYLLFAPPQTLDLDTAVLNTEAHPLQRTKHAK